MSLADLLLAAADGRFPPVDGGWSRVEPWRPGLEAVLAFTGHAVLAVGEDVSDAALAAMHPDGYGGAHHPSVVTALAAGGWVDSLDALLVARGVGGPPRLAPRAEDPTPEHPRVRLARELRDDVRVLGRPGQPGLVMLSRGIAGLPELSIELPADLRGRGGGRDLLHDALTCVPAGDTVLAAVAPGNAASLRAFLAAGFVPIASVQLYRPQRLA